MQAALEGTASAVAAHRVDHTSAVGAAEATHGTGRDAEVGASASVAVVVAQPVRSEASALSR